MDINQVATLLLIAEKAQQWPTLVEIRNLVMVDLDKINAEAKKENDKAREEAAKKAAAEKAAADAKVAAEAKSGADAEAKASHVVSGGTVGHTAQPSLFTRPTTAGGL